MSSNRNDAFWPSYVDIMTTLFAIMLILFAVSFTHFKKTTDELKEFQAKYEELVSIYSTVENIDSSYFKYDSVNVKHIFKLDVKFQDQKYDLRSELELDIDNPREAKRLRKEIINAGNIIKNTIENLQNNDSIKQDIKYLVVIEGQASKDNWPGNDILSYQRALNLNQFWIDNGIDFANMDRCELVICGSGEKGVPRAAVEKDNQRFLVHIVPVIGNIHRTKAARVGVK